MDTLYFYTIFWTCVIGLCIGSFLNVVILRALGNESIIFPSSKCNSCNTPLKWYHNIPVFSYLFLKGKCAFCKEKISIQYPLVELTTMFVYLLTFLEFGYSWNTLFLMVIFSMFIVVSMTDIKEQVVFDAHTYSLIGLGILYSILNLGGLYIGKVGFFNASFINGALGAILGIVIMEALSRLGYLLANKRAFGEGDTYIAAGLGFILGWQFLVYALIYGFIIQVIMVIPLYLKKLFDEKDYSTMSSFIAFFIYSFIFKYLENMRIFRNNWIFLFCSIILIAIGVWLCRRLLKAMKDPTKLTYLPFGPAMYLGATIVLFMLH